MGKEISIIPRPAVHAKTGCRRFGSRLPSPNLIPTPGKPHWKVE